MPLVPVAHSDQQDHGAMLLSRALDLRGDRRRGAAELGEHDLLLERVFGGGLVLRGRGRRDAQAGIHVVLLAAAVPRRGDLGPNAANAIVSGEEPLTRGRDRLIPLRISDAVPPRGPTHRHPVIVPARRAKDSPGGAGNSRGRLRCGLAPDAAV
jgi:hypothetical protein